MFDNVDIYAKTVAVRVDFNVPLNDAHEVTDDTRIRKAVPTIQKLVERGARVLLMSHLGRPLRKRLEDGSIDRDKFTLKHVVSTLSTLLGQEVSFVDACIGPKVKEAVGKLENGQVLVLENTRFHEEETAGDEKFARALADNADFYVNDAFGTAHRAHASTAVMADFYPDHHTDFGLLMSAEIKNATKVLEHPVSPYVAVLGGAKVSDKILLIERLLDLADEIIVGGGMAYTFFAAKGGRVGNSLVEEDKLDLAIKLLQKARSAGKEIHLPHDSVIADAFSNDADLQIVNSADIPEGWMGLDIGPKARAHFGEVLSRAKTILWNGPMGVFEFDKFSEGTMAIADHIASASNQGAFSLVGGGDSVAAVNQSGKADQISFISTGGGAMLEFLEGKTLPGIAAIQRRNDA